MFLNEPNPNAHLSSKIHFGCPNQNSETTFTLFEEGNFDLIYFPLGHLPIVQQLWRKHTFVMPGCYNGKKNTPWFCQVVARSISPPAVRNILTRGKGIRRIKAQWGLLRLDQKPEQGVYLRLVIIIIITIIFYQIRNLYKPEPEQVEGAAQEVGPVDNTLGKIFWNLTNCCASKSYENVTAQLFLLLHGKILSELFLNMTFLFRVGFRISLQPIIDEIQFHNCFQNIPMGPNCPS